MTREGPGRVGVVVVSYFSADDLAECLRSVLDSGIDPSDVTVVDNASKDDSLAVAAKYMVQIVSNPTNVGFARAVNQGARTTVREWLLLLNPDAHLQPGAVDRLLETASQDDAIGVVGPRILTASGDPYPTGRTFPSLFEAAGHALLGRAWPGNPATRRYHGPGRRSGTDAVPVDWVSGACMLVPAARFHEVGGLDERYFMYGEDMDLCLQMANRGWQTVLEPRAVIVHRGGVSARRAPFRTIARHHRSLLRFYRKRHARSYRGLGTPLIAILLALRAVIEMAVVMASLWRSRQSTR